LESRAPASSSTPFSILLVFHIYREVQFGGWGEAANAFGDIEKWRAILAVKVLGFGLLFLAAGLALLRRRRPPS
jgi:hypothetical protein